MDQPVKPLAPVENLAAGDVVKVNDSWNRTARTLQNFGGVAVFAAIIKRSTGVDLSTEEVLIVVGAILGAWTFIRNVAEFRGWIPSTKKEGAEIAPPKNDMGQTLAQVK